MESDCFTKVLEISVLCAHLVPTGGTLAARVRRYVKEKRAGKGTFTFQEAQNRLLFCICAPFLWAVLAFDDGLLFVFSY